MMTEKKQPNLFLRNDTIFGVCEALGEDFGFNPQYLRIALILPLFWFPVEIVALYFGLGLFVLVSRLLVPARPKNAKALALRSEANEDQIGLSKAA